MLTRPRKQNNAASSFGLKYLTTVAAAALLMSCSSGGGDTSTVTVAPTLPVANTAPTVKAGTDQTVYETRSVVLNGSITDPDNTPGFEWVQTAGPNVTIEDGDTLSPSFETPDITTDAALSFELRANDGVNAVVVDTVIVNVTNVDEIGITIVPGMDALPFLLILAEDSDLPIDLFPVADGTRVQALFDSGQADGVIIETYIGAKLRARNAVPDLELVYPFTWRGFFEVADLALVSTFTDLIGQSVVIAGPPATSDAGASDVIFRAAAQRHGIDLATQVTVVYTDTVEAGRTLVENGAASAMSASAVDAVRIARDSQIAAGNLGSVIDFQNLFNGPNSVPDYKSIPTGLMPLGGLHMSRQALDTPGKRAAVDLIMEYYADAANRLVSNPATYAKTVEAQYVDEFIGIADPLIDEASLVDAILNGNLVYRTDIDVATVQSDLGVWINELIGLTPDAGFFNTDFGPYQGGSGGILPAEMVEVLKFALADERNAWATYDAVLKRFGEDTKPFVSIKRAEQAHIDAVLRLYATYEQSVPPDTTSVPDIVQTATLAELCQIGVDAEIENIRLYNEELIPASTGYDDITQVMTSMRDASENSHLPAFRRCAG